jgi:sortase A
MLAELMVGVALAVAPATTPAPLHVVPPPSGAGYGTIAIPALDLRAPIRQLPPRGTGERVLDEAVGHLPSTYGPGMGGTVALFGHRVTPILGLGHGPFRYIDRLHRGDLIVVRMPYGRYVYRVRGHRVVLANAWSAFKAKLDREVLLLAACHPPGSAAYRYVVRATSSPTKRTP